MKFFFSKGDQYWSITTYWCLPETTSVWRKDYKNCHL
jgi:hypothetical protein